MTDLNKMIDEKAESVYDEIIDAINNAFVPNAGEAEFSLQEGLRDFDAYLQALLVEVCIRKGKFTQNQADFIGFIVKYGSMSEDIDITLFGDCNFEMRERLSEITQERLKTIPKCFLLSCAIDKKYNRSITKSVFGGLMTLGYLVLRLEGEADLSMVKPYVKSIVDFIVENSVEF